MATSQAQTRPASSSAQDTGKGRKARGAAKTKEDVVGANTIVNGRSGKALDNKRKAGEWPTVFWCWSIERTMRRALKREGGWY
jgi:hypothetical protein